MTETNAKPNATVERIEREATSWLDSTAAKVTGVIFAIGATAVTARDAISRGFFKTMNKGPNGVFKDLQDKRDAAIDLVNSPAVDRVVKDASGVVTEVIKGQPVPNAKHEIRKIVREYDRDLKARKKLIGFNNVFDEMNTLKKHQWLEVAFATGAVASVAVGAIMAIASSRGTAKKHEEVLEQTQQQNSLQR